MCGIVGFTKSSISVKNSASVIRCMTDALVHRGPDGQGFYSDDHVELGHRRLSIIDLESGQQPMSSRDGRYQIVFNGEIYNYVELRQRLESRGVRFRTQSDTEVLLNQFVLHGKAGLSELNGMFAFAVWDCLERTLFVARDRMGIKPLHYAHVNGELIFASEIKSILLHPAVRQEIYLPSISKYFTYGFIPVPDTIYRDIQKLEPGHFLEWKNGAIENTRYWDIPLSDQSLSGDPLDASASKIRSMLKDAIAKRFRSDVAVGIFLSGGLDSSLVTALAAKEHVGQLSTFSMGFDESSYDESTYAREVSDLYGTKHYHEVLTAKKAASLIPKIYSGLDEPFGDASVVPTYCLSQFTAQHVKTVLGGDGGDELFAGYPSFMAHSVMERLSVLPMSWRDALVRVAKRLPSSSHYASAGYLLDQFFKGAGIAPEMRFMIWMGVYGNEQKSELLHEDLNEQCIRENPFEDIARHVRQSGLHDGLARLLYVCAKMYLQDGVLVKVDRAAMANSLEVRVPYLDHNLVEYVSSIPLAYKLKGVTTKYLLKKIAMDHLPRHIVNRRKAGFMMPLADWMRHDMRDSIHDLCSPEMIRSTGLFNPGVVERMLREHDQGKRDYRKMIWALFTFQYWYHHVRTSSMPGMNQANVSVLNV